MGTPVLYTRDGRPFYGSTIVGGSFNTYLKVDTKGRVVGWWEELKDKKVGGENVHSMRRILMVLRYSSIADIL